MIYSDSGSFTDSGAADSPMADLCCSTGIRPRLVEFSAFVTASGGASTPGFYLRRIFSTGIRTSPRALQPENPGDPALTGINLVDSTNAWTAPPTLTGGKLRYTGLPGTAAVGSGFVWSFPRGLMVAQSLGLCVAADGTASGHTLICSMVADLAYDE